MDTKDIYDSIINISQSKLDTRVAIRQICSLLTRMTDCTAMRIGFDGEWYCSDDFHITGHAKKHTIEISQDSHVLFEFYFGGEDYAEYDKRIKDGTLETAMMLTRGYLGSLLLEIVKRDNIERKKELSGINMTSRKLVENATIEETLSEMCQFLPNAWQYPESTLIRIKYGDTTFTTSNFCETEWRMSESFNLPGGQKGSIEVFYTQEFPMSDEGPFMHEERSLLVNLANLIAGNASKHIYSKMSSNAGERLKELTAINRVTSIINNDLSIKDTLQQIVNVVPLSWQYPEVACARITYENMHLTSPGFKETEWMQMENFVTVDNKKGLIEIFYTEEMPESDNGPFLSEETQLLANIAKLVCGYFNNYKGRELFNTKTRSVSTHVNEDFRKTLTTDKQPLQLFFNKQILEKYVYLDMMKYKIKNILFVATLYDAFTLENDDSFFEQFMGEIYQYSLFSLPRITGVTSPAEALELMEKTQFDLAILMVGLDTQATITLSADIKERQNDIPVFLLLNQKNNLKYFENLVSYTPSIDKLFVWSGNSQILFSIVKSIEDNANVENDTKIGLVRVILLVEDSPIYYSKYLQILFSTVFNQVQRILGEGEVERNEINKISKMRQRPKILHARNYEDAMYIFEKYKDYLLCVISDVEFDRNGSSDPQAGVKLVKYITQQLPTLPAILQSAEPSNKAVAESIGVEFLNKDSDTLQTDLVEFLTSRLGFGDFIFRNASGRPLAQAKGFKEFETIFKNIPTELLGKYCYDNRISSWLMSRGEIPLARKINPIRFDDYEDPEKFRQDILGMMDDYRANRRKGKILDFDDADRPDERNVISMSQGSLGGKGRGLAFINSLIQNTDTSQFDKEINVRMPITAIVGTDEFSHFMERGNLYEYAFAADGNVPDYNELRERFAAVPLSDKLMDRLKRFLSKIHRPLAVRSSSLSEDSMNQPFAGVFDTYLVPNNADTLEENVRLVATAIKMVYSSIYSETSRTYFQTIRHNIEAEKMAVVLQVLAGNEHHGYYYPHISGTAQSYNYYPVAHMKPEEGFAVAAVGLGYYVVGGSKAFRFSPVWPGIDTASTKDMVRNTQVDMLAIDLSKKGLDYVHDGEHAPLATLDIYDAEKHGTMRHCLSVYNPDNDTIEPGIDSYGPRIVNFANILKYNYIPLPSLLSLLLNTAKEALGSPVEIEWAVDLDPAENGLPSFYLLQMKPIITELQGSSVIVDRPDENYSILYTEQSLGNGDLQEITDIIYADPDLFDKMETEEMAKEIDALNAKMLAEDKHYILIGAGRWGTRDRFIGIPVQWSQISMAKVIIEMSLPGFPLDSSLGSHFFHNVTSMNIGYLSVQDSSDRDYINWENIRKLNIVEETKHFKHVSVETPLSIKMNGKERKAAISLRHEEDEI